MALLVTEPIFSPVSLEANVTVSFFNRLPLASLTVAVAAEVEVPLARTDAGASATVTVFGPVVPTWTERAVLVCVVEPAWQVKNAQGKLVS